jgi:tetratricopeptide (TPR) repeat protein
LILEHTRGLALLSADRTEEAEVALRKAVKLAETTGSDQLAKTIQGLGLLYEHQGHYEAAVATYHEAIERLPRSSSGEVIERPAYFERLALNLAWLGRAREAERAARHAVEIADRIWPETQLARPFVHINLAMILQDVGHDDEALAEVTAAVAEVARLQGPRGERYGEAAAAMGGMLVYLQRYAEAEPLLARACDVIAFSLGEDDAQVAGCEIAQGAALVGLHRAGEALPRLSHAVPTMERAYGKSHMLVAEALLARGNALAAQGDRTAAVADFERAIAILTAVQLEPGYLATAKWRLGRELWTTQPQRARAEVQEALRLFEAANRRWSRIQSEAAAWLVGRDRASHRR